MRIGILGGGYFWGEWGLPCEKKSVSGPYGDPADVLCIGALGGHQVISLQRHGCRHELAPHDVPWRANAHALWQCELDLVVHVTVCGALSGRFEVGDLVLFDQLIDFTRNRPATMGPPALAGVNHMECASPINEALIREFASLLGEAGLPFHARATMVTIEGPRFSTRAESAMYKLLGGELINMTSAPEVFLLRELGLPVVALGLVSDKDTSDADQVSARQIARAIGDYKHVVPEALKYVIPRLAEGRYRDGGEDPAFGPAALGVRANFEES